jgi:hypothetical protein
MGVVKMICVDGICEYCYRAFRGDLPDGWDVIWQSYVCKKCLKKADIQTTKGGEFACSDDPRGLNVYIDEIK